MEDETLQGAQEVLPVPGRATEEWGHAAVGAVGTMAEPWGGVTVTSAFPSSCRTSCNSSLNRANPFQGHSEELRVGLLL